MPFKPVTLSSGSRVATTRYCYQENGSLQLLFPSVDLADLDLEEGNQITVAVDEEAGLMELCLATSADQTSRPLKKVGKTGNSTRLALPPSKAWESVFPNGDRKVHPFEIIESEDRRLVIGLQSAIPADEEE